MNTLLVPSDFSLVASNALNYAIGLAKQYSFEIKLYHVVQMSTVDTSNAILIDMIPETIAVAEKKMSEMKQHFQELYPQIVFTTKVEYGIFIDCIKETCNEINPIAVVMGITGNGTVMDKIIGSNTLNIMQECNYPLIIVPKNSVFKPFQKIGFACDLKNVLNSTPIIALKAFSKLFDATLHILNIDYKNKNYTPDTVKDLELLNTMLDNIKHEFHFIEDENVQHAIDTFVEKENVDMLIMLPKKHSWIGSIFHKSQSKEMAYHTHIPLLMLHPF